MSRDPLASHNRVEIELRKAAFPSDALSVKRLRVVFPERFDGADRIADGYTNNNFFFPVEAERPSHLVRLSEVICDERTIAAGAFYSVYLDRYPELLQQEDLEHIARCVARLELNYQYFKLADSPETARLLIEQVKREGEIQARQRQSIGR